MSWVLPPTGAPQGPVPRKAPPARSEPRLGQLQCVRPLLSCLATLFVVSLSPFAAPPALLLGALGLLAPTAEAAHLVKPTNLTVTVIGSSARLTWNQVDADIIWTDIEYGEDPDGVTQSARHPGTGKNRFDVIPSLTRGKTYRFRLRAAAHETHPASGWTEWVRITIPTVVVSSKPRNVRLKAGNGSVTLTWDQASQQSIKLTDIEYGEYPSGATRSVVHSSTVSRGRSWSVSGLANGRQYRFRLRAAAYGNSPASDWTPWNTINLPQQQSNDATLSNLIVRYRSSRGLTYINISPSIFSPSTTIYTALGVGNRITHLEITPTTADSGATVKVGTGAELTAVTGGSTGSVPLAPGENVVKVEVTAEDGTTTRTYTLTILRASDTTLSGLTATSSTSASGSFTSLSIGTFASGTTSYTATVANSVTHVKLTPTASASVDTIKVGKGSSLTAVTSGSASGAIPLAVGANAIKVEVTSTISPTPKRTYTLTVTRQAGDQTQSTDATLSALSVTGSASAGGTYAAQTLSPAFAASTDLYTVNVAKDISHVKLNATTTDSGATMKVLDVTGNDVIGSLAGGTASRALPVNPDRNILVLRVTAADGTTKDYYVYVQRAAIPRNLCVEVGAHPNGSPMLLISIQDAEIDTTITYSEAVQNGVAEDLRQFFQVKRSVDASWPARAGSDNWPAGSQADGNIEDGSGGAVIASCGGVDGTVLYDLSEPGVTYNVRAHHVNENTFAAYGESTPVKTVTTWNLPGKPTSVSATAVSQDHTKLRVAWSAPTSTGGTGAQITGYKVRWRVKDADGDTTGDQPGDWNNDDGVAATGTTHDATGLSAATEYEVQVRALNGINPGSAWSDAASGTTGRPSPAQAPTNLVVTAGDSKLDLYWTASSGAVTGYDVHYTAAASGTVSNDAAASGNDPAAAWVALTRSGTTAAQTISSLSNGTAYRVRVRGKNSVGNSNWVLGTGTPAVISNDATLSGLTASSATSSGGSYTPLDIGTFASGTTSYTATVENTVTHVKLTPTVNDSDATVKVGKQGATLATVTSGSASSAIALAVGANALKVEVTAEDGATTQSYTVTVTRQAAQQTQSTDATLSGLTASSATSSGGSYTPLSIGTFASGTTTYTATVENTVTHVKLTPTVNDSDASVTVNGNSVAKGSTSGAIALAVGSNAITVEVTAEDGATTRTYTVTVTRQAAVTTTTPTTPTNPPNPPGGNTPPPLPPEEITPPPEEIRPPLVVSVMGGEAVTEGEAAHFTLSVNPPPVAGESISVAVTVSDSGDFATPGATGARTVTLDEGGTASFSVATQDDALYEDDGAITATVVAGDGYIPSRSNSTAAVKVENNDPPVVVSVMGGEAVTEGEAARFTISVTPPPVAGESISVAVTVSDSGDFAAPGATGARTVTVDESGAASFSVATQDDALYEDDGAITATVEAGDSYTPSVGNATAVVNVENNDPAVVLDDVPPTLGSGSTSSYTVRLPQQPTADVQVDIDVEVDPQAGSGGAAEGSSLNSFQSVASAGKGAALSVVVEPSRLVFTPSDWDRPQQVTVTIPANAVGKTVSLIHRPRGGGYGDDASPVKVQFQVVASPPPTEEKRSWHVRFGRTLSQQVVDALQQRFSTTTTPPGLQLTVAGQDLTSDTPLEENHVLLSRLLGFESVSSQELAQGSSFSFSTDGAGARLSFWGKGAFSSFNGIEDTITLTGEVTTALLGAEWNAQRWQAGAALSHSWGNGSYQGEGDGADGRISSSLTGIFPYGRYALTPRLGLWATAGYGWGNLSLNPDGDGSEYNPATTMALGAVGMDGLLLDGGSEGITLTTTADALFLKTSSEAVAGLESSEGNISRLRLGLEASRAFPLANGASLSPSLEVGLRQDSGDAETGFGMDLGAGLSWSAPEQGITATVKGRTLLSHGAEHFQDQGLALSFSWQPTPSNRGASLSLSHAVGLPAEGGLAALLNPTAIEVLDEPNSSGERFEARLAYGFPFYNDRLTLSPAVALALSNNSRTYGLLWSLAPYHEHLHAEPWELSLEGERQEAASSSAVDHSLKLRFALPL